MRRPILWLFPLLAVAAAITFTAAADEDRYCSGGDVDPGNIVPLERLFVRIREEFEGRILKVELENEEECAGWIYEVKLLAPGGYVMKLEYDAKTMELLWVKGHRQRDKGHRHRDHDDD